MVATVKTRAEAFRMLREHFPKDGALIEEMELQCTACIRNLFEAKLKRAEQAQENSRSDWGYWQHESEVEAAMFVLELFKEVED